MREAISRRLGTPSDGCALTARRHVIPTSFPRFFMNEHYSSQRVDALSSTYGGACAYSARLGIVPSRHAVSSHSRTRTTPPPPRRRRRPRTRSSMFPRRFPSRASRSRAPRRTRRRSSSAPCRRRAPRSRRDATRSGAGAAPNTRGRGDEGPDDFFLLGFASWSETGSLSKPGSKSVRDSSTSHLSGRSVRANDVLSSGGSEPSGLNPSAAFASSL